MDVASDGAHDGPGARADRRRLAATFDEVADLYDRVRTTYPAALFDDLFALGALGPGARVLEIGAGTGKASVDLAARGARLICVEPGPALARRLAVNLRPFPDAEVVVAAFEACEPTADGFDAVVAATAWHWVDPRIGYPKVARLLRPGGVLALWTAGHAFPVGFDPFFLDIQPLYDEIEGREPGRREDPPTPDQVPDQSADIERSGFFAVIAVRRYVWSEEFTADGYIELLETFSGHRLMAAHHRQRLHPEVRRLIGLRPNGIVTRHHLAVLHVARRLG